MCTLFVCVCVCVCAHTHAWWSAVGLFLLCICCWGFPGCPRQCRMFLLRRKAAHFSPPTIHQSICPPPLHLSLALCKTLSLPEHRCICPFPSQWKKHKIKSVKILFWQGPSSYRWTALCVRLFVAYILVSGYICTAQVIYLHMDCMWFLLVIPSTCVLAPTHLVKHWANQPPSLSSWASFLLT